MTPNSVRILGIDYQVDYEDSELAGWSDAGKCHATKCIIKICTHNNSQDHQKSVLLHEIIEALNYRLELKLDHNVLTLLEAGFFSTLQDNPELVGYLGE